VAVLARKGLIPILTKVKSLLFFIYSISTYDVDCILCITYAQYLYVIVEAEWAVKMNQTNIKLLHKINQSNRIKLKTVAKTTEEKRIV